MKKVVLAVALGFNIIGLSTYALGQEGQEEQSNGFKKHSYWAANLGKVNIESKLGAQNFDFAYLEGRFGQQLSEYLAWEADLGLSISQQKEDLTSELIDQKVNVSFANAGVYGVLQSRGPIFAKARLGLGLAQVTYSASGYEEETETGVGLAYGVGAGIKQNNWTVGIEYTVLPEVDDPLYSSESFSPKAICFSYRRDM